MEVSNPQKSSHSAQVTGEMAVPNAAAAGRVLGPKWDDHDTFSIVEAGKILGLARGSAYAAAKKGEIPVIWIGRRCIVPRHALEQLLAGARAA